jgi:hypothetical protein
MKFEQILARPPLVLSQEQREFYFENGHCTWQGLLLQSYCIPAIHGGQMWQVPRSTGESRDGRGRAKQDARAEMCESGRPLLLHPCTAADALPLTPRPSQTSHEGRMIRGQPARWVAFDADACQLPPGRSNQSGVTIFSAQNREHSV